MRLRFLILFIYTERSLNFPTPGKNVLEYMLLVGFKRSVRWIITDNIDFSSDAKEVRLGESIVGLGNTDGCVT